MRVTRLSCHLVHPGSAKNLAFVRVDTDAGIHGWGECYTQSDRDRQVAAHVDALGRYLVGLDPTRIRAFTHAAYDDFAGRRGSMDYYCAISGIEQALWDILGKQAGLPVHALLGGACRDSIRVYANGWSGGAGGPDELAEKAQAVVERGFTALKFDPVPGPWRTFVDKTVERQAVANVHAVRDAVGDDVDILVEMHRRLAPMHAVRIAAAIEDAKPYWFEEPVLAENVPALARAKREINIPVVTGEALYTKFGFREVFETGAADIINPDVCNVGGILELKEIAAMAEPYFVAVSPHNYNSTTVGLAATLQASAVMPNFLITEYFVGELRGVRRSDRAGSVPTVSRRMGRDDRPAGQPRPDWVSISTRTGDLYNALARPHIRTNRFQSAGLAMADPGMQTERLHTVEQIRDFLEGNGAVDFRPWTGKAYGFARRTLVRLDYDSLGRAGKGAVRGFLGKASVTRLIGQYRETDRGANSGRPFARVYTPADIRLLARRGRRPALRSRGVRGDAPRVRGVRRRALRALSRLSPGPAPVEDLPPRTDGAGSAEPGGRPGHVRVDTVHQGERRQGRLPRQPGRRSAQFACGRRGRDRGARGVPPRNGSEYVVEPAGIEPATSTMPL